MGRQEVAVDAGLVVEAVQAGARDQAHQVAVAGEVAGEQGEVEGAAVEGGVAVGVGAGGDVDLAADDGADALVAGGQVEVGGGVHGAVVGDGDRVHAERGGALDEVGNATEAVEQAEFAVDVEVGESGQTCAPQVIGDSRFWPRRRTNGGGVGGAWRGRFGGASRAVRVFSKKLLRRGGVHFDRGRGASGDDGASGRRGDLGWGGQGRAPVEGLHSVHGQCPLTEDGRQGDAGVMGGVGPGGGGAGLAGAIG